MTDLSTQREGMHLITVKALPSSPGYEWLSESALRHLIFNAQKRVNSKGELIAGNGLDVAIIRIGRKVLIDLDAFDAWVESKREVA